MNNNFKYRDITYLTEKYVLLKMNVNSIAKDCNTSKDIIYDWLKKYNIPTDRYKPFIDKITLEDLYVNKKMSTLEIGRLYNKTGNTIGNYLKRYNISIRSISENNIIYFREKGGNRIQSSKVQNDWKNPKLKEKHSVIKKNIYKNKPELRMNHSSKIRGINIDDWEGFITPLKHSLRKCSEYKNWRISVYKRDSYKCRLCGKKGNINAHHIVYVKDILKNIDVSKDVVLIIGDLKKSTCFFDVDNGMTLCIECHKNIHSKVIL